MVIHQCLIGGPLAGEISAILPFIPVERGREGENSLTVEWMMASSIPITSRTLRHRLKLPSHEMVATEGPEHAVNLLTLKHLVKLHKRFLRKLNRAPPFALDAQQDYFILKLLLCLTRLPPTCLVIQSSFEGFYYKRRHFCYKVPLILHSILFAPYTYEPGELIILKILSTYKAKIFHFLPGELIPLVDRKIAKVSQ